MNLSTPAQHWTGNPYFQAGRNLIWKSADHYEAFILFFSPHP